MCYEILRMRWMENNKMKTDEVVVRISEVNAAFKRAYDMIVEEWKPEQAPITIIMAEYGLTTADAVSKLDYSAMRKVMTIVEECMVQEGEVANAVGTGLVEALLSESSAGRINFVIIAPFVGEKTRRFCREWDAFTGVETPGL